MVAKVRAELRRFERRWLRPLFERVKKPRYLRAGLPPEADPLEELLVALLRSQIRHNRMQAGFWTAGLESLRDVWRKKDAGSQADLEQLVNGLLAIDAPSASFKEAG